MVVMYRNTESTKDGISCSTLLFSLCGGDDNYDTGIQENRNAGSTKTTCPAVLFYSLFLVVMIIKIQEYRK